MNRQHLTPAKHFFFTRIFPLFFLVAGLAVGFFGVKGLINAKASVEWPQDSGEILMSEVDRNSGSSGSGGSSTTYHAAIVYSYQIDDVGYESDRVAYGDYGSSDSSHAREIVRRYPVGEEVQVFYHPDDPRTSLLEPGVKLQAWFLPLFGLIFTAVGTGMFLFLPRMITRVS